MKKIALLSIILFVWQINIFGQTVIADPSGTNLGTSGTNVAASGGITYSYTNSSWPSSCIAWGFDKSNSNLGCINGMDQPPWNCANWFTTSSSISGNIAYLNTSTTVRYTTTGGSYTNGTLSARLKITATTSGGTPINFAQNGNTYFIPVTGNFNIKVEMELYGPGSAIWFTNYQYQWRSALDIFNNLHTDPSYSIYSSFNFSETDFYSLPSSSTTPTITNPNPCGGTVSNSGFTFTWSGNCTIHPNSRYESSFNGGAWTNHGSGTSRAVTLNVGANTFRVRYYDGCNAAYYTSSVCTIYYAPVNYCGTVDHGGNDWTISSGMTVSGNHINIGDFQISAGITATVSSTCHYFYVEAENVNILGTINGNGAGNSGGSGGSYGGLWAADGSTDGRGITYCWDKDNCRGLGTGGGVGGGAASGTGGGLAGGNGGYGYGAKQQCGWFGDDGGVVGGGGGGGGGAGGTYGGSGGNGIIGGQGGSDDNVCGNAGCYGYSEGSGGSGGSSNATYGSSNNELIEYGSGGGGAGGGGRGSFCGSNTCYTSGSNGGAGGGAIKLYASQNLSCSGNIYANGTNGGNGGEGGENDYTSDCCSDLNDDCTEQTYSAPGGGGSGAGGGSGGGIMLKADCEISVTGILEAKGGNGGNGGDGGWSDWSSTYYGGKGSGGAGGGGGRIKIFRNPCSNNTISATISVVGGTGGSVASFGRASTGSNGNSGAIGSNYTGNSSTAAVFDPGEIDSNQSICYNTAPSGLTSTIDASGGSCGSIIYQWMQCTSGCGSPPTNYSTISGATSSTYNPPAVTQTTYYVRRAISENCTEYSDMVTVAFYNAAVAEGTWVGATNTDWFECTNWGNGRVPTAIMNVVIPASCTYYPNISSGTGNCFNIDIATGASLTISGGTLNVTGTSGDLGYHGIDNYGTLTISSGTLNVTRSIENRGGTINISNGNTIISEYLYNMDGYNSIINISGGAVSCLNLPNYQGTINHSGGTLTTNGYYREQDADGGNYYGSGTATFIFNGSSNMYLCLMKSGTYFNNVYINGDYYIETSSTQDFDINGSMNIENSKSFDCSSRNVFIAGDFTNNGTYTAGTGIVNFNGSSQQSIISNGALFYDIVFNNTNGGNTDILLMDDLRVTHNANFTNGIVGFANPIRKFIFGTSATSNEGTITSFVDGIVEKSGSGSFTIPSGDVILRDIGAGNQTYKIWAPITINPVANTTTDVEYFFSNSGLPTWWNAGSNLDATIHHVTDREYWLVSSTQNFTNATLYWKDNAHANGAVCTHSFCDGDNVFVPSDLTVAYWTGTLWRDAGGVASAGHDLGSITSALQIPFGAKSQTFITFASKDDLNPLPVELTNFKASCYNQSAEIIWQTLSETNNNYFVIEKSNGKEGFYEIARVKGAGNSNNLIDYLFTDDNLYNGDNYYRLTQVDYDGKLTVYDAITINCDKSEEGEASIYAYPNPFTDELNVVIENLNEPEFVLEIYDDLGRLVFSQEFENTGSSFKTKLNLKEYRPAVYNLRSRSEGSVLNTRVVKR